MKKRLMKILSGDYYVCIIDACIRVTSMEDSLAIARTAENRKLVLKDHQPIRIIRHKRGSENKMIAPLNAPQKRKFPVNQYQLTRNGVLEFINR